MVNLIGAYIVTIGLIAIVAKRPSLERGERILDSCALWLHSLFVLYLFLLFLQRVFNCFSGVSLITIPSFVLSTSTLWIHEAGHIYWSWGGELLHSLGGTLNEILFPIIPAILCFRRRYMLLMSLFLYWLGFNFIGISTYMGDARAQKLPLLGAGTHDWRIVLGKLGLLDYDLDLALIVWIFGCMVGLIALIIYCYSRVRKYQYGENWTVE